MPEDWDPPALPRLWRYNLHYFDDLNASDAADRSTLHRDLIDRWIDENPAPHGTGWEPYPTSLRIVNWIKWTLAGNELNASWRQSLSLQVAWLEKNIEWHLLGNHLFSNAKALVFAGCFFSGREADHWLSEGLKILQKEVPEQVLADGGQFERSPMYHALALEDLLDLINLAGAYAGRVRSATVADWRSTAVRMIEWLQTMCHPDGHVALFNDSAFGVAADPARLFEYARRNQLLPRSSADNLTYLRDSGYVRSALGPAYLIADVGEIGPDYLPGHAHADTLAFELSCFGNRYIVDSGCSTYEIGDERLRQRGTSAHNTVTIDNMDSSEVWSSFRVARRAHPGSVAVNERGGTVLITASHDGYQRLPGKVGHHREFEMTTTQLLIRDKLDGCFTSAVASLLFHPDVAVQPVGDAFELSTKGDKVRLDFVGGVAQLEQATWHPEFGASLATSRIRIEIASHDLLTRLSWSGD